jgi:hypothetical protein
VVDDRLACASQPTRLNRGVLEVAVGNSAALQELTFQKRQLLKALQQTQIGAQVRDLRFRIATVERFQTDS